MIDAQIANLSALEAKTAPSRPEKSAVDVGSYLYKIRACHDIIGLLKRTRPAAREYAVELEGIVTRAHEALESATSRQEAADAQCSIDSAYQMLLDLRRARSA